MRNATDVIGKTPDEADAGYYALVDRAFEGSEDRDISNSRPNHAAYIIHKLLDRAEQRVLIYSGRLKQDQDGVSIYGSPSIIDAARKLLRKPQSELSIVVEKEVDVDDGQAPNDHPLIAAIQMEADRGWMRGKFDVKSLAHGEEPFPQHFVVMDDRAYRVETDGNQLSAIANFGDPETAKLAADVFGHLHESSDEVCSLAA